MRKLLGLALCGACSMIPTVAGAETLRVSGIYPAQVELPGEVDVLATERFGGDAGPDVSLAIADILGEVVIEGEPYFRILPASPFSASGQVIVLNQEGDQVSISDPNAPDAVLRGSVRSEVIENRIEPRIVEECVERDEDDNCTKREDRRIPCREVTVRLDPRIVLIANDGTQLYSQRTPAIESVRYCMNDSTIPSTLDMANRLVDEIAYRMRVDLAPVQRSNAYRIMESRKGLNGDDRDAFRDAVKLTKTSPSDACTAFQNLMRDNPGHLSTVFNTGLCSESFDYLDNAEALYRKALQIDPKHSYPSDGLSRIRARKRALAQLEARDAALEAEQY